MRAAVVRSVPFHALRHRRRLSGSAGVVARRQDARVRRGCRRRAAGVHQVGRIAAAVAGDARALRLPGDPFWSPDGTRLYYISLAREREGLWSISAAGGEPELVIENVWRAAFSPDGKTLAMLRARRRLRRLKSLWLSSPPGNPPVPFTRDRSRAASSSRGRSISRRTAPSWRHGSGSPAGRIAASWPDALGDSAGRQRPHRVASAHVRAAGLAAAFGWLPDSRHVVSALPVPRPGVHLWVMDTTAPMRGSSRRAARSRTIRRCRRKVRAWR